MDGRKARQMDGYIGTDLRMNITTETASTLVWVGRRSG